MAKTKTKQAPELKAAELPALIDLVDNFKSEMKASNMKWKKMGRKDVLVHMRAFVDKQLVEVEDQDRAAAIREGSSL